MFVKQRIPEVSQFSISAILKSAKYKHFMQDCQWNNVYLHHSVELHLTETRRETFTKSAVTHLLTLS